MKNLNAAIACALRNGCVETEFAGRFTLPEKYTLNAGDEILVPTDFVERKIKIFIYFIEDDYLDEEKEVLLDF